MEDANELQREKREYIAEMDRRIAIAKKEKELEDLKNGKPVPTNIFDKFR